jgi:hypothetical protein
MFRRVRADTLVRSIEERYQVSLNARGDMKIGSLLAQRRFDSPSQLLRAYRGPGSQPSQSASASSSAGRGAAESRRWSSRVRDGWIMRSGAVGCQSLGWSPVTQIARPIGAFMALDGVFATRSPVRLAAIPPVTA